MDTIIFDDAGRIWNYGSPTFRAALHCPAPDFDLHRYVTDILGFVALKRSERSARLYLRPGITTSVGLAAALFALVDDPPERLVISHPGGACGDEVFVDIARAFDRIAEIMGSSSPTEPARFVHEEQRIDSLLRGKTPLSALLQRWCMVDETLDLCEDRGLLESTVHGRLMLVEATDTGMRFVEVGDGFSTYNQRWRGLARGAPLEHQPDYEYGVWVRQFYERVARRRRPHYDQVDAVIRRPHLNDAIRVRYQRLLLPLRPSASNGSRFLGVSLVDETINLRSANHRERAFATE